ncbi:hypothetical protein [Methylocystis sp. S23]
MQRLGLSKDAVMGDGDVQVPAKLLKLLLQLSVSGGDFDKSQYLLNNPDIDAAVKSGKIKDPRQHYVANGFFEGRSGAIRVDEYWYLRQYPDVAKARREGKIDSATKHFFASGELESRAPRKEYVKDVANWGRLFPLK